MGSGTAVGLAVQLPAGTGVNVGALRAWSACEELQQARQQLQGAAEGGQRVAS